MLTINPTAAEPTASQIAVADLQAFDRATSRIHTGLTTGLPAVAPQVHPVTKQVMRPATPALAPEDYRAGLVAAVGEDTVKVLESVVVELADK